MKTDRISRAAMLAAILTALPTFAAPASAQWSSGWRERVERVQEIRQDKYGSANRAFGVDLSSQYGGIAVDRDTKATIKSYARATSIGHCIAAARSQEVAKALETLPASATAAPTFKRLLDDAQGCGSDTLVDHGLQRGILSEAAYLITFPNSPALPSMIEAPRLKAFREEEFARNQDRHESEQILADVSNCLVMSNLSLADRVARAEHGGAEEEALLEAMFATAPYCVGPERPADLGKSFLRSFLMESLYRATVAATDRRL